MSISVIVPIYNVEKYLERCVNSIINQTYTNLEILLVDDGSTDRSPAICDELAAQDSRVKALHKPNGGVSDARNYGLERATGEYISFVDGDDYIHPEMLARLMKNLQEFQADISVCGFQKVYPKTTWAKVQMECATLIPKENVMGEFLVNPMIDNYLWNKLYRRDLFDGIRFPEGHQMEDVAVIYKIFEKCGRMTFEPSKLYYYYQRGESIVHTNSVERECVYFDFIHERFEFLKKRHPDLVEVDAATIRSLMEVLPTLYLSSDQERKEQMQKILKVVNPKARKYLSRKAQLKYFLYKISPEMYIWVIEKYRAVRKKML